MSEQNSPPGANVWNKFARMTAKLLLIAGIGAGWLLTKSGGKAFDAGAKLETWARDRLRGLS